MTAPLPSPAPRTHVHTRNAVYRGYYREDGLWDIEAELTDAKTYVFPNREGVVRKIGEPVHDMAIRVTVDDNMTIRDITASMANTPFAECKPAIDPMRAFIGQTMGTGWREAITNTIGGIGGCTHLRELLFNMATVAFQTMPSYQSVLRRQRGEPEVESDTPARHFGRCMAWDFNGPVVARVAPQFIGWKTVRPPKPAKPA
ncbi:MAG: DUF2889 domain-containing protein [Burkholderiaceae bacterium]|nr:DUF2889 domain-containing protein [Burkholderiaceae bacterium]MDO9090182.1 DUF2889 domain-containing protein [Burkholderiaceae bacterium]